METKTNHATAICAVAVAVAIAAAAQAGGCSCESTDQRWSRDTGTGDTRADDVPAAETDYWWLDTPLPDTPVDRPYGDTPWEGEICDQEEFTITHVTPDMMIVIDRSNSMNYNGFWGPTRDAVMTIADAYDDQILFGLMVFPDMTCVNGGGTQCDPSRGPLVNVAPGMGDRIRSTLTPMQTCGGTPIAETLRRAHQALLAVADTNPKYVLLATDGAPNCNGSLNGATCRCTCTDTSVCAPCYASNVNCLDDTRTYAEVDSLYSDRIKTFVVGMSTAATLWGDVLGTMATKGGTERFYPAENPAEIDDVFEEITGLIASCEFDLNPSDAADPDKVNFYFDGEVVPRDTTGTNGWDWVDEDTVKFYGSYCDALLAGSVEDVSATYGCPSIVI